MRLSHLPLCALIGLSSPLFASDPESGLQPDPTHPRYWNYHGETVMLLGGSNDDNLFQMPEVAAHLDAIAAAGGNYVRNTMSDRSDQGWEVRAFHQLADGRYDLTQWNPEYWERFDHFLQATADRGIFVQIEVWDRFDHSRDNWTSDPYNPANTVTYTTEETGLELVYPKHPGRNAQPFFYSTPAQRHNPALLRIQEAFVAQMLSISLRYDHVLYCIDNETSGDPLWADYWSSFIQDQARAAGRSVCLTEMWDAWDLSAEEHRATIDHPERYAFIDGSQSNHQIGQAHWDTLMWLRDRIATSPRPVNSVKVYGADGGRNGRSTVDGLERFWRHLLAGTAAIRFHRPTSGLGFTPAAETSIRAARMITERIAPWHLQPDNQRLSDREDNEAYLAAAPGEAYVVYFPTGGEVTLDLRDAAAGPWQLRWLNPATAQWEAEATLPGAGQQTLVTPGAAPWLAVLLPAGTSATEP